MARTTNTTVRAYNSWVPAGTDGKLTESRLYFAYSLKHARRLHIERGGSHCESMQWARDVTLKCPAGTVIRVRAK